MTTPLHLVACVAGKLDRPAPAAALYTSDWFRKAAAYVEAIGAPWRILSAKHGLLHPAEVVAPYDVTLGGMAHDWERLAWGDRVMQGLWELVDDGAPVVLLAGKTYREPIAAQPSARAYCWRAPMEGLGIGEQKAWLAREAAAAGRPALRSAPAQAGLELGGFGTRTQPTLF
jgi:hypothetical protein